MAGRAWHLLKTVFALGSVAMLAVFFMEYVYLPQRHVLDHQHSLIGMLAQEVQGLRNAQQETRAAGQSQSMLEKRVALLEMLTRHHVPDAGVQIDKLLAGLSTADSSMRGAGADANHSVAGLLAAMRSNAGSTSTKAQAPQALLPQALLPQAVPEDKKAKVQWREDNRCGIKTPGNEGKTIGCNPTGKYPCCSPAGWCGDSSSHCTCNGCIDYRQQQKSEETYHLQKPKAIALVVPFRDRASHLENFRERIEELVEAWNKKDIKHTWVVFVVEQFDNELFNRGWLFNVGFKYAMEYARQNSMKFDCVVMHDVDILPTPVVDYGWCLWPNQLSGEIECWKNSVPYQDSTGGVISMSPAHWNQINGFSNEYQGWGGEDDDLYLRLKQNNLLRGGCHTFCQDKNRIPMVFRPKLGEGRFTCLNDGDHTPRVRNTNDSNMWKRLSAMKTGSQRWRKDGISQVPRNTAGAPLESAACANACEAPEDPTPRRRLFAEHWSRVSLKPIAEVARIHVVLPDGRALGSCSNDMTRPLSIFPIGLDHLRRLLPEIFGDSSCNVDANWAASANFVLLDTTDGLSVMVGSGAAVVTADSALTPLTVTDKEARWTYRIGKDGHTGCASGMTALTESECREMTTYFSGSFSQPIATAEAPHGCHICPSCGTGQIRWNRSPEGQGAAGISPICKEPKQEKVEKEYVVQGQRLSRWMRRLPADHHGWIMVASRPMKDLREQMIQAGHRHAQVVPACIATAVIDGTTKHRVTPGTVWCGDAGWKSEETFYVLRSKTSVPQEKLVPICISYNSAHHVYRFENSPDGCVGVHRESSTHWVHLTTVHTTKDAQGPKMCVGILHNGPKTRWMMKRAVNCATSGFDHTFSFRAMKENIQSPFQPTCLQRSVQEGNLRLISNISCRKTAKAADGYRWERDVITLATKQADTDIALCTFDGTVKSVSESMPTYWRLFKDDACNSAQQITQEVGKEGKREVKWLRSSSTFYLPRTATGPKLCICRPAASDQTVLEGLQFVVHTQACAGDFEIEEFCFNTLSANEAIQASFFVDEPV